MCSAFPIRRTKAAVVVYFFARLVHFLVYSAGIRAAQPGLHRRLARADRHHRKHPALDLRQCGATLFITGIGEGLGAEIAGTFARAGYDVLGLSRSDRASEAVGAAAEQGGGRYPIFLCDLAYPADISLALRPVSQQHRRADPQCATADDQAVRRHLDRRVRAGLARRVPRRDGIGASRAAAYGRAQARHRDFSGATAGLRGGANFSAFASAKFALRGLAQALAREFGPNGVHIAHS